MHEADTPKREYEVMGEDELAHEVHASNIHEMQSNDHTAHELPAAIVVINRY